MEFKDKKLDMEYRIQNTLMKYLNQNEDMLTKDEVSNILEQIHYMSDQIYIKEKSRFLYNLRQAVSKAR
jgi:hypothetical protein